MRLSLIRHGKTEANENRLYCGSTDIPLGARGRLELNALKEETDFPSADIYITSGMKRANETLRIIYGRSPDAVIDEFREMDFGVFEMKSHAQLEGDPEYQRWINGGNFAACPGGESRRMLDDRVKAGLDRLLAIGADSAVVICHGGVVVSLMERLFNNKDSFYEWHPRNGRGYTLDINFGTAVLVTEI